ncbi:hypothetical protein PLESTB_000216900 [Pleodorina starrii]|uniref:Uncharacterized protein n=1 Tax=Pleodorina starrii TaxID=330485 RepID=A0A9W6BD82_9CHLO|nr:hypothetical protein PLESTB_000216900 [Pleodorina starrii]GLC73325.1 hypothetical protein PLESTF_001363400 [Pleodorina starrii]
MSHRERLEDAAFAAACERQASASGAQYEDSDSARVLAGELLQKAVDTAGRESFSGCMVPFNRGWVQWIEDRFRADIRGASAADEPRRKACKDRLDKAVALLRGGTIDTLLATGATSTWRKKMLQLAKVTQRV